jgi:excisionase family DNA binding protein
VTALDRELARALVAALRDDPELRDELRELLAPASAAEPGSPWLSVSEAAEHLRVSERTLQRMAGRNRVRSSTIGRRRLYHRDDLDALTQSDGGRGASANPLHPAAAKE